jgi:hypothetical protein
MKHAVPLLVVTALGLLGIGCTPTPEKTCDKLQELADKEADSSSSKKPFKLSREKCLKNMNEMKERDPEAYKCTAKVIAKLSNLDTAFMAISVCDKNKPKKSADDDDEKTEKAEKKKTDDDDDAPKKKKKSSDDE